MATVPISWNEIVKFSTALGVFETLMSSAQVLAFG